VKYLVMTIRKPQFDAQAVPAHYAFLKDLRERGILEQAGPFTDRSGGAYVISAGDHREAWQIALEDPLHINDCSEITVREWDAR
jgi:uncharacterized protein YciI